MIFVSRLTVGKEMRVEKPIRIAFIDLGQAFNNVVDSSNITYYAKQVWDLRTGVIYSLYKK